MNFTGTFSRHAGRWAATALVITLAGAALLVGFWVAWPDTNGDVRTADRVTLLVTVLSYGVAGAVLVDRRPDLPFGWLLAGTAVAQVVAGGLVLAAIAALHTGSTGAWPSWALAASGLIFLPIAIQGLVYVRFPSGRPASRRARVLEAGIVLGAILFVLAGLFGATSPEGVAPVTAAGIEHPLTGGTAIGRIADGLLFAAPIVVLLGLIGGIGVVFRFVRAEGIERQQLKWMTVGIVGSFLAFPLAVAEMTGAIDPITSLLFVLTLAVPVLRYRLWAIDTIIRRSLVYGTITAAMVLGYVALATLGALLFTERVGASVAAAVAIVAFIPLQTRTQRFIDKRVYGDRSDPYRAVSDLTQRLSETTPAGETLRIVVETIASSLRLPYVAIEATDGSPMVSDGEPGLHQERWPLAYEGRVEGQLVASPRRGEIEFGERDRRVLAELARQAGSAVHAEALTADLLDSRHRLVTAREEERRRLRRDLHDGLGPVLTAVGLNLDAARSQLRAAPDSAEEYIDQAKQAAREALEDVRRLVYGLRPPALDSLGLIGALQVHTSQLQSDRTAVTVCAADLPSLPAALEVAVYRTVMEAVTNSVRHGGAQRCTVNLCTELDELVVDVHDDGIWSEPWAPGVGLTSLREQAEELGGTLTAGPTADAQGHVRVRYPIVEAQG